MMFLFIVAPINCPRFLKPALADARFLLPASSSLITLLNCPACCRHIPADKYHYRATSLNALPAYSTMLFRRLYPALEPPATDPKWSQSIAPFQQSSRWQTPRQPQDGRLAIDLPSFLSSFFPPNPRCVNQSPMQCNDVVFTLHFERCQRKCSKRIVIEQQKAALFTVEFSD
jgi:hypothetical protein